MQVDHQVIAIERLQTAGGHIGGIVRMLDDDRPIDDILQQLAAVEAAIQGVRKLLVCEFLGQQLSELCSESCSQQRAAISHEIYTFLRASPHRLLEKHAEDI